MPISYVGGQVAGRAGSTSTSTITFALTGGSNSTPQPGDVVVITPVVASQGRNPAQAISGYTALGQLNATATTYDTSLNVSWKEMGNTPDTSFTLPSTGNIADAQRYSVQVWRGVDVTGIASASATGTGTGRPNPPSITPTVAGSVVLICAGGAAATGASYTAPTDFTTNFLTGATSDTNDAMVGSGYWTGWTSGAVDPGAYTGGTTNAADSWAAYTIVLPPLPEVTRAAPTYVDSTIDGNNSLSVNNISSTAPTMISGDLDLIIASAGILSSNGAAPGLQTPSGFTPGPSGVSTGVVGGAVNTRIQTFWREATGSGSSATLTTVGSVNAAIIAVRKSYRGVDMDRPLRQAVFGAGASSTSHVLSSLAAIDESIITSYLSLGAAQGATPPGSMTEREDSATFGVSSADETLTADGATGTRTFTVGSATDSVWGLLELQGAPVLGPVITSQPEDTTVLEGETATFSLTATGATSYQWQIFSGSWSNVSEGSGGTTDEYSLSSVDSGDDGKQYRCVVTNAGGSTTSETVTLTVHDGTPLLVSFTTAPPEAPTSTDTKTILAPSGVVAGNWEVILVACGALAPAAAPVFQEEAGWTLTQSDGSHTIGEGVFNLRMGVYRREATGAAADVVLETDSDGYWGWHRLAYEYANDDFIAQIIFGAVAITDTPVLPSLTPTKTNALRLDWHALGVLAAITPASGMTEVNENTDHALGLYTQQLTDLTPTGTRTYGYDPEADAGYIMLELHGVSSEAAGSVQTATLSASAAIQLARAAAASVATAVQAPRSANVSTAMAVQLARSAATSLDAAIEQAMAASAIVQAAVQAPQSASASVATAVSVPTAADADVDLVVQAARSASASVQAAVQAPQSASASVTAALQVVRAAAADLDLAVQQAKSAGADVSLQVQASFNTGVEVSLQVQAAASASVSVGAAVQALRTATTALTVALSQANTAALSASAAVLDSHTAGVDASVMVQSGASASASVDAAIEVARGAATSAQAAVQARQTAQAEVAAAVVAPRSAATEVSLQVQEAAAAVVAIQAAVQFAASASLAISTAVAALRDSAFSLDAAVSLHRMLGTAADAAVLATRMAGTGVSLYVQWPLGLNRWDGSTWQPAAGDLGAWNGTEYVGELFRWDGVDWIN